MIASLFTTFLGVAALVAIAVIGIACALLDD